MSELRPCPMCDGTHIEYRHIDGMVRIECCESEECGCAIGCQVSMNDAITAWNTRPVEDALIYALKALLARHNDGSEEGPWAEWDTAIEALQKAGIK